MDYNINATNLRDDQFRGVYLSSKTFISYNNFQNSQEPQILITKDYLQMSSFYILYRKHSCLKKPFDLQLSTFHSSGLVQHWEEIFTRTIEDIEETEPKELTVDQIIGII